MSTQEIDVFSPVRDDEARRFPCPTCNASKNQSCVYVGTGLNAVRAGAPTKRSHKERCRVAFFHRFQGLTKKDRQKIRETFPLVTTNLDAESAWRAQVEWERRRWVELRSWLRENYALLQTKGDSSEG